MYIESIKNRTSPPCILLRECYWHDGKPRKRTLANLSKLPPHAVEALRQSLKGTTGRRSLSEAFKILRSLPHGHVAATLGAVRNCGLEPVIASRRSRQRDIVIALIVARILDPQSKLATVRGMADETAFSSLAGTLGIGQIDENEVYAAMDWLVARQAAIERKLARKHLKGSTLVLYDVSSTWFEGRKCPLARHGYSRDRKRGKLQIVFGLMCDQEGCPVAVEAFEGNTADPATVAAQVEKLRTRFRIRRVALVGDRGMLTEARIREDVEPAGIDWITALRAPGIRALVRDGALRPTLFDQRDMAEISCEELYPGERLIVCRNPLLAEERTRNRNQLLQAAEAGLDAVVAATRRERYRLKGAVRIAGRASKVAEKFKMKKHFEFEITDNSFSWRRKSESIAAEAALDGFYIVRTSVPQVELTAANTVAAYKSLAQVERAFRAMKSVDLKVRPIYHYLAERVRAHLLLCMLAWYVERHMRRRLAPMLFDAEGGPERDSIVAKARPPRDARAKAATKRTADGLPAHSFRTLLKDLATLSLQTVQAGPANLPPIKVLTEPTPVQEKAFCLLGVTLKPTQ